MVFTGGDGSMLWKSTILLFFFMNGVVGFSFKMEQTYQQLAQQAIDLCENHPSKKKQPVWIAVTGGPGSGKSTLTDAVVECIHTISDKKAVGIPMDGYHYTKMDLKKNQLDIRRRGAPWTFDAPQLCHDLLDTSDSTTTRTNLSLATYCRETSDPIPNQIKLDTESTDIILVEGNYLTLGSLLLSEDVEFPINDCPPNASWKEECQRWKQLLGKWDQTWFISVDPDIQRQRLIRRHLQTWTPEKTLQWKGQTDEEAATIRTDYNDMPNAKLINLCQSYADTIIPSL